MWERESEWSAESESAVATLTFEAENVTGTRAVRATFQGAVKAGAAATAIASRMSLPTSVPWALRSNRSSEYLDDEKPLSCQIAAGEKLTLTPKAHLGA